MMTTKNIERVFTIAKNIQFLKFQLNKTKYDELFFISTEKCTSLAFLYLSFQVISFPYKIPLFFQCSYFWPSKYFKIHFFMYGHYCVVYTKKFWGHFHSSLIYLEKSDEMLSWQGSLLFFLFVFVYLVCIKKTAVHQPRMIYPGVIVSRLSFELCNLSRLGSVMLQAFFS